MSKYLFKNIVVILLFPLVFSCCKGKTEKLPNLVYIFSDQHSFDMLGCYGNQQIITPNLDKLAAQGIRFTHCFSNCPLCTPYRGILMSGQQTLYNGAFTNDKPLVPGHGKKFAEVLRDTGYHTAYVGKWHLLGGDRDRPIPKGEMRYGFDELFYTNNCHVDFRPGKCFYWNENNEKVFFDKWEVNGQTEQALDYLDSRKGSDKPFALFVSWHAPHNNGGYFEGEDGKMHFVYDAPEKLLEYYNPDTIKLRPGMDDAPHLRKMYHGFMSMVTGVDIAFGKIMDKLNELGIENNTLVIFTSDHGDMLEFQDATGPKTYAQDYSSRVPFLLRWPDKIKGGNLTSLLFSTLDIMPTTLSLMGLNVPQECQGKDLSKAILNGEENVVDFIPLWMHTPNENHRGIITKDYSFSMQKDTSAVSLYNVLFDRSNDPYQLDNRFHDPEMADVKQKLYDLTWSWMEGYGDKFFVWEDFMKVASDEEWDNPPYIRPIDILK